MIIIVAGVIFWRREVFAMISWETFPDDASIGAIGASSNAETWADLEQDFSEVWSNLLKVILDQKQVINVITLYFFTDSGYLTFNVPEKDWFMIANVPWAELEFHRFAQESDDTKQALALDQLNLRFAGTVLKAAQHNTIRKMVNENWIQRIQINGKGHDMSPLPFSISLLDLSLGVMPELKGEVS